MKIARILPLVILAKASVARSLRRKKTQLKQSPNKKNAETVNPLPVLQPSVSSSFILPDLEHAESLEQIEAFQQTLTESSIEEPGLVSAITIDSSIEGFDLPLSVPCLNSDTYLFNDEPGKTCKWIRNKEYRRQSLCTKSEVRSNCPQSCGLCCDDDPNYNYTIKNVVPKTCEWITEDSLNQQFCNKYRNGRMVRDGCSKSCNFCQSYIPLSTIDTSEEYFGVSIEGISTTSSSLHGPVCEDNANYTTPFQGGCGCDLVAGTDCNLWSVFLNDSQMSELYENCPVSCGVCG